MRTYQQASLDQGKSLLHCVLLPVQVSLTIDKESNNQLRAYASWQLTLVAAISFANVLSLCRNGLYLEWIPGRQRKWQPLRDSLYLGLPTAQRLFLAVLRRNVK